MRDLEFSNEMTFHNYSAADGIVWNDLHTNSENKITIQTAPSRNNTSISKHFQVLP